MLPNYDLVTWSLTKQDFLQFKCFNIFLKEDNDDISLFFTQQL